MGGSLLDLFFFTWVAVICPTRGGDFIKVKRKLVPRHYYREEAILVPDLALHKVQVLQVNFNFEDISLPKLHRFASGIWSSLDNALNIFVAQHHFISGREAINFLCLSLFKHLLIFRRNLHGAVMAWQTVAIVIFFALFRVWTMLLGLVAACGRRIVFIFVEDLDPPLVHLFLNHFPFWELLHARCRPIDFTSKSSLGWDGRTATLGVSAILAGT